MTKKFPLDAPLLPLLDYWRSKLHGRRLPAPEDIEFAELPHLADRLQLVENAAGRYRYERVGRIIVEAYGSDPTGKYLDEYLPPDRRVLAWRNYAMVTELRCPLATRCTIRLGGGDIVKTNRLILPLIGSYGRVAKVLTGFALTEAPPGRALRLANAGRFDDRAYALELLSTRPEIELEPVAGPEPALVVMP